jgi:hypothetical protein
MIRINDLQLKTTRKAAAVLSALLLFAAVGAFGQAQQINLTAGFDTTTMPDGTVLPMWGYTCGTAVTGSTATCAPLAGAGTSLAATGALGGVYVVNGGSGYTSAPGVLISAPTGITGVTSVTATANAVVNGGQVAGFILTNAGAGYTAPPTITLSGGGGSGAVASAGPAWSPVVITVPTGAAGGLQINLTNNLSFTVAGTTTTASSIPTSIVIVGQVGGGLGGAPTTTMSPSHTNTQGCVSWFIADPNTGPGVPCTSNDSGAYPPAQGPRVQSMGAEVTAVAPGTVTTPATLTWANLRPGTYLLESGTHPSIQVPMGLIGMLVVTCPPGATTCTAPGTAYGAVTQPTGHGAAQASVPAVQYGAEVPLEFSEIDPVQNKSVDAAVRTAGFSETMVWSAMPTDPQGNPGCGNPASTTYHQCYPPAVNYTPFYYLINGVAFNKVMPANSVFAAAAGGTPTAPVTTGIPTTGTVLVRLVNAGLRMHVPSIVGSLTAGFTGAGTPTTVAGFTLIAEDGNPIPNLAAPRVQTDVFMAAGKVYDVMVNVPALPTGALVTPALPIYARDLALSGNSSVRDAGMLAYISVNNALGSAALSQSTLPFAAASAQANPDTYNSISPCAAGATSCIPLVVSDPSKGVIGNDVNVYGVALVSPPTSGSLSCSSLGNGLCANGTFTYTPTPSTSAWTSDSFGYCANGAVPPTSGTSPLCTTVSLGASNLTGAPVANPITFMSKMATFLKIPSPGVLSVDSDPNNLPLTVITTGTHAPTLAGGTLVIDANGGFTASVSGAGTATCPAGSPSGATCFAFSYYAQNSQGVSSASPATVTLVFPKPSNLQVNVLDAQLYASCNGNSACISGITPMTDYRWIIEEDKTFWIDPNCTTNSSVSTPGCPSIVGPAGQSTIPTFGVNFHTSFMDYVAQGCTGPLSCEGGQTVYDPTTGKHVLAVCDVGNGACRPDPAGNGFTHVLPSEVTLDPSKRYYISVLPGDAANPFPAYLGQPVCGTTPYNPDGSLNTNCGHTMSGAPIPPACNILGGSNACTTSSAFTQPVNVLVLPTPLPTGKLSVIVFEDDFPLNGEQDGGGGNGTVAPIEPGLGGFNIVLWDTYGGLGDVTGQNTYDDFNQPLSNSLAGTIDPATNQDACPISATPLAGGPGPGPVNAGGMTGMIVTCPKYEADGHTLSPLAGQAVIANLMPEKFSVQAYPGADRIARGEEWLQTNTLDGQHPHDSFIRIGEPSYFQEYGPAGYHVAIGFANPAIINARHNDVCAGFGTPGSVGPCTNTIDGQVDVQRLSRTPDQRLYPSGSRDGFAWTQCWVSLGDPDGEDFMFTKCDANGNFRFTSVPGGNWRLTIGDQWNDQIIDGLSTPANVGCTSAAPNLPTNSSTCPGGQTLHLGNVGVQQWQSNLYTRTFIDDNKNGIWDPGEIGIPFIYTMIHYRDGHNSNSLTTDFNGVANFNETFPLFNWYVVEADDTRYKTTGIHTVYDAGGPADGSPSCGNGTTARKCGTPATATYNYLANTFEAIPLPADLSVPGAVYCAKADCAAESGSFSTGTAIRSSSTASTGRIDPPWVWAEGWSGLTSQSNWIEFGKAPFAACPPACATVTFTPKGATSPTTTQVAENGGIYGQVQYASTRPFDDAGQMIQQPWEPYIPNVTVNLYQQTLAADGVTPTITMVDTTQSSSWDAWAQGFYPNYTDPTTGTALPYMSCPGQGTNVSGSPNQDLFYFTLYDQPNFLDYYTKLHSGITTPTPLPYNSQYKCYDAMHIWNQIQPAPYDGRYSFPSSLGINPATGKLVATVGSTNGVTASMAGTNCTVCVANPDSTDPYRVGTPMLPPGTYVVEVIMPPGYEIYKEEDKNLLIGDNFIGPVTQQFAGLGTDIFIIPDQANVASLYEANASGVNPTNYQDETTNLALQGGTLSGVPGFPGYTDPVWPCVGELRIVPDYLSLFPQALEVAPFAGATRPLCDRKQVVLTNQMSVRVKFALFTSTHIASKFTGVITDDFTSEFDPFAPQFGEKFAPPNLPISTKDYLGNEISRVYSDHWGVYNGLTYSSWEVNPPNITGYSPTMMTQCMNDPGPILDTNPSSPTHGQMITDPLYNPAYSDFCYEEPYMPGLTNYTDTPVVPTEAFVGAAYNSPDCSYPDATPAVKEVDGDGIGPWVSAAGKTLTITALGNVQVNNSAYSGPSANTAPFNAKTVGRHYGFGSQCTTATAGSTTCNTVSAVTIGGKSAAISSWSDTAIVVTVPTGVPNCAVQQQAQYGGSTAQCGQLVITAGNGKQSIDAVTVTIGGSTPKHVSVNQTIQGVIDGANPGDLIIVDPTCMTVATTTTPSASAVCNAGALDAAISGGTATQTASVGAHTEMLIMWKPVRLQGVGAVSSVINANAFPAGQLLDPWRRHINCIFGLTLQGVPMVGTGGTSAPAYDPTGTYSCPDGNWVAFTTPTTQGVPQIDRLPLEAVVGWDATVNGNLAEQLQEPSLMGAYEGAGITVLAKGVWTSPGENVWTDTSEGGAFPSDALLLQDVPAAIDDEGAALGPQYSYCFTTTSTGSTTTELVPNPYPSNFECNPSSIDGLSITDSSQGGGGIFVHGWAHNLQIANNRVYNNAGTLSGGISVGQGEFPIAITVVTQEGAAVGGPTGEFVADAPPSCQFSTILGTHLPYCLDLHVNVHNNSITSNSALGDELFSGTLSGGGGISFCTGSDYYKFNYNFVCGNLSSAEGGGVAHVGFIYDGDIEHNTIVLNQSTNPTIPTNGGGIVVMGTPDTDPVCGTQIDQDCPPGLSDGTGPNLIINANLIQANTAESGSGGGIRLQQVNGTDVSTFPTRPTLWNDVSITNNMIVNNVAGWDGGGISLQDSLNVSIINNTIASNDSLASSGVLTQSIGTPQASAPAGSCVQAGSTGATSASCPQSAGVTSTPNSSVLTTTFTGLTITCPTGQSGCTGFSNPLLQNNVIWQNRAFYIGITGAGTGNLNQQNLVSLFDAFTGSAAPVQAAYGQCTTGVSYWDVGVRGDNGPSNHSSGFTLHPTYSLLDDPADYSYTGGNNVGFNPVIVSQYCNGSRVPPTCTVADGCGGPSGYGVPPGIVDASTPNPVFSLTPSATVDEGNNWINVSWGPLALSDDSVAGGASGNYGGGSLFANYALAAGSPAIDYVPVAQTHPTTDFFGNPRPDPANTTHFDIGAVEFQGSRVASVYVSPTSLEFPATLPGSASAAQTLTVTNATAVNFSFTAITITAPFSRPTGTAGGSCAIATPVTPGNTCTINIVYAPTATSALAGTATITGSATVVGSPVQLTAAAVVRGVSVSPSALAFGNWASGTSSNPLNVTVTNTGDVALAGGTFTITPTGSFSRVTTGTFPAGAPNCAAALAVGASCTIKVVFAAGTGTPASFAANLTVAYTGTAVSGSPVALTGSRVTARGAVTATFAPIPWILGPGVLSSSATVTLTNSGASGASNVAVTADTATGAGIILTPPAAAGVWAFGKVADTCTGLNLVPGASCTLTVEVVRVGAIGTHNATVTFTDNATGSPQTITVPATFQ